MRKSTTLEKNMGRVKNLTEAVFFSNGNITYSFSLSRVSKNKIEITTSSIERSKLLMEKLNQIDLF